MTGGTQGPPRSVLARALHRVTRPPVLTVFAILQACLIAVLVGGHLSSRVDPALTSGDPGTGDFTAFYTGAVLVEGGRGSGLYDFTVQDSTQATVLGRVPSYWQHYLNPPGLAIALSPTVSLGYVSSFLIFTAFQAILLTASLVWLSTTLPGVGGARLGSLTMVLLAVGCLPVALTTFGGQNTGLSLGLLAGVYAGVRSGRQAVAGILLGLLSYKPQYAILLGVAFLVQGRFRILAVAGLVALGHYLLGAWACGPDWPFRFLTALSQQTPVELVENGPWQFSLPPVVRRAFPAPFSTLLLVTGGLMLMAAVLLRARRVPEDAFRYPAFFGLVVCATLFLSPHLLYYEVGILVLPAVLGIETLLGGGLHVSLGTRLLLALAYFSYPLWPISDVMLIQPLFLVLLGLLLWTLGLASGTPWWSLGIGSNLAREWDDPSKGK